MPRVRKGAARRRKHKRVLKAARGYIGAASRRYRIAREARLRADRYATIGRKLRKRDFRRLWITRISAACRQRGLTYSRFMHALSTRGVAVNRKVLADLAVSDPAAFDRLAAVATAEAAPEPARARKPAPAPAAKPREAEPGEAPPAEAEEAAPKRPAKKAKAVKKARAKKQAAPKAKKPGTTSTRKRAAAKKPPPKKTARSKKKTGSKR